MKYIGAHVSVQGGVEYAPLNAGQIGADAFALFTKNQRQWKSPPLTENSINEFKRNLDSIKIDPAHILPHDSYLINLGNADKDKRRRSVDALTDEALRAESLGLKLLNFHPGAHLNQISTDECISLIAEGITEVIRRTDNVIMVIENTAGMGSSIGSSFEEIAEILKRVPDKERERTGVCLDTCHLFSAGYDISTEEGYNRVFSDFERIIGFLKLKALHLNDSKSTLGKRLDRHASLGEGELGIDAFRMIMKDHRMDGIPFILETPDDEKWPAEIEQLRSFIR